MSNLQLRCVRSVALLLVAFATVGTVQAKTGDYFSSFGKIFNEPTTVAPGGECVATSFINGAVYLKSHYPETYGSTNITIGGTTSSSAAAHQFGSYGWTSGGTTYDGYYKRCINDGNARVFGDMWQTTVDWMEGFAPGKTAYSAQAWTSRSKNEPLSAWPYNENVTNCPPTYDFLHDAVTADKFVQLSIYTYTLLDDGRATFPKGHSVNLLDISATSITFQDPNNPGAAYTSSLSSVSAFGSSALSFYDGYSFGADPVMILTAFALTPVPEPSTFVLIAIGVFGMSVYAWRKRRTP